MITAFKSRCVDDANANISITQIRSQDTKTQRSQCMLACGLIFGFCAIFSHPGPVSANQEDELPKSEVVARYLRDVKPVLIERCLACHGALKQEAGLRIDTAEGMLDAGVILAGDADGSALVDRITAMDDDYRMPPEGHLLTAEQIAAIRDWIARGAPAPENELPEPDPDVHWSFVPPRKEPLPSVLDFQPTNFVAEDRSQPSSEDSRQARNNTASPVHPIDAMLELTRRQRGVTALPLATREEWIRRVYLDLIGLPPTPEEIDDFVNDSRSDAWERVVDRLLASPQYGERWGRHWMDVWRYSDWYGLGEQLRNSQKHLWHWRDWIVESLNDDVGYDRMLRLMLAADELEPENLDALRATGFLARNYYLFNRTTWIDETLEHTSKAFLGLTVNCAKCHDHKYDPISQVDYYRMRAIFEPHHVRLDPVPSGESFARDGVPRVYDQHLERPTYVHIRGDEAQPDTSRAIEPGVPEFIDKDYPASESIPLPLQSYKPALRDDARQNHERMLQDRIERAIQKLDEAQQRAVRIAEAKPTDRAIAGDLIFETAFDRPDQANWRTMGGTWEFNSDGAHQSEVGAQSRNLRLLQEMPTNFVAALNFTTVGGQKWKSVGIAFDVSESSSVADQRVLVYLSAVDGGSKLQVSYGPTNAPAYPDGGRVDMQVIEGEPYLLEIAVRDQRINVRVNEQFRLSFDLPNDRVKGALELVTFDAKARFTQFRLQQLREGVPLIAPGERVMTAAQAKAEVLLAEAELEVCKVEQKAWQAACVAEFAKAGSVAHDVEAAVADAANLFQQFQLANLRRELAEMDAKLLQEANEKTREQLQQQRLKTEQRIEELPSNHAESKYMAIRGGEKALEGPDETAESRAGDFPNVSSGRRSAFANWLTDAENPLTARVAVNHIWMRHFGQPLVESVSDFGRRAPAPTQQRLLDWLACDFVEHNWSMKHLHRLIVTSQAYRQSSRQQLASTATTEADPSNETFWCRRPVRMESELVRDSLWRLAGLLDERLGGPSIGVNESAAPYRRSLYFLHSRDDQQRFLAMFDNADILRCYRREESVIPQQALALSNSKEAIAAAQQIAAQHEAVSNEEDFVRDAYKFVLGVTPGDDELNLCLEGYQRFVDIARHEQHPQPRSRAREMLILSLLNCNDFITIR